MFPTPVVYPPQYQCSPATSLSGPQASATVPVYHHYQQLSSVAVQTRSPLSELSPSPSPVHFTMQEQGSLSRSTTPSVSPQSTPNGSPSLLKICSPPEGVLPAVYSRPTPCSFVFPTRTSPTFGHHPVSANPLPLSMGGYDDGHGLTFASRLPYFYQHRTTSTSQAPMYFVDMTPPHSGKRVNSVIPPFPQFYQV